MARRLTLDLNSESFKSRVMPKDIIPVPEILNATVFGYYSDSIGIVPQPAWLSEQLVVASVE